MKKFKKIIIVLVILIVLALAAFFGWRFYSEYRLSNLIVTVYDISNLNNAEWIEYDYSSSSTGMVSSDSTQRVYGSTKEIVQINVSEGDEVEVGDVLLVYDNSAEELSLERKEIALQQTANEITKGERELERLGKITPVPDDYDEDDDDDDDDDPEKEAIDIYTMPQKEGDAYNYIDREAEPYAGSGSEEDPYRFLCRANCYVTGSYMNYVRSHELHVVLEIYEGYDIERNELVHSWRLDGDELASVADDDNYEVATQALVADEVVYDEGDEDDDEDEDDSKDKEEVYTVSELAEAIKEQKSSIEELTRSKKRQELELRKLKNKASSAELLAKINGKVSQVITEPGYYGSGDIVVEVETTSGNYITGTISELMMDSVKVGDKISATSWNNNQQYTAVITEISDEPEESSYSYGTSENCSYYPFKAYIDDAAGLEAGDALDIKFSDSGSDKASIVIEKAYVKKENGNSYVYKADANGKLARQQVVTGKTYYGYYVEIKQGLSESDAVAFPYGKNIKVGASVEYSDEYGYY